ncbi:low temperature requirement protein A [Robertkochia sediminum]|uniref:low temperature requirement protein A n=1 Tax=Robertkochia sediminum TaxID=2785326 RepID=UPI0019319CC7|nr:low temperature requirement protein A [Robertkochia sediminum]MBL7471548.1 low temperature requirement protein A [Robertkochia sediminum]
MSKQFLYNTEGRHATWLELFFDLIFVVALGQVTHFFSHAHDGHLFDGVWSRFLLIFIALWWIWVGHTVYSNRFDTDARKHRVATLALMFIVILISGTVDIEMGKNNALFVGLYVVARLMIAGFYFTSASSAKEKEVFAGKKGLLIIIGALISLSSLLFTSPYSVVVFFAGILFDMVVPFLVRSKLNFCPIDREHLVERAGLLAIILLGESVISLSQGINDVAWDTTTIITASLGFFLICMIWWIYFDSFPLLIHSKRDPNGFAILYSQLFTYMAFAILANMIRHTILMDLDITAFRFMAIAGMVSFYIGKQVAYFVNIPEYRYAIIRNTVITFAIVGASLLLSTPRDILIGMCVSMMAYIVLNWQSQIKLYGKVSM